MGDASPKQWQINAAAMGKGNMARGMARKQVGKFKKTLASEAAKRNGTRFNGPYAPDLEVVI